MTRINNLTIIVPLRNNLFVRRKVAFLQSLQYEFSVIFADGSPVRNEDIGSLVEGAGFRYVYCGQDHCFSDLFKKLLSVCSGVSDSYIFISSDDDFFDPQFLFEATDFLDANRDFSLVSGGVLDFDLFDIPSSEKRLFYVGAGYWHSKYRYVGHESCLEGDPMERLKLCYYNFWPWESVMRTGDAIKFFSALVDSGINDFYTVLYYMRVYFLLAGKTQLLTRLFVLRQDNTAGSAGSSLSTRISDNDIRSSESFLSNVVLGLPAVSSNKNLAALLTGLYKVNVASKFRRQDFIARPPFMSQLPRRVVIVALMCARWFGILGPIIVNNAYKNMISHDLHKAIESSLEEAPIE